MTDYTPETTTPATTGKHSEPTATAAHVTYGGVNDRPDDVNHPDNLEAAANSTDPSAPLAGFTYDADTDTYTRSTN